MPKRDDITAAATPASRSGVTAIGNRNALDALNISFGNTAGSDIEEKQKLAWKAYNSTPELHFLGNLVGSVVETIAWYGAVEDRATSYTYPPPIDGEESGYSEEDQRVVRELIEGLHTSWGTQQDFMRAIAINLFFPAEVFLLHTGTRRTGWTHELIPKENVERSVKGKNNKEIQDYKDPITLESRRVGDRGNLHRIWRPHPGNPGLADSPVFPVLGLIEELNFIQMLVNGLFHKRIMTSGILALSNSILGPDYDPNDQSSVAGAVNTVEQQIIQQMSRNIDPDSSSPALPVMIFMPFDEVQDGIKYIEIDNDLPDNVIKERREVRQRIATGLDVPAEFLLGLGEVNHWSAWLVRDLLWSQHVQPLASLIANSITTTFLRPTLRLLSDAGMFSGDPNRVKVWFQSHQLATHPDLFTYLITAHDKGLIGKEPILRALGIPPESSISTEEFNLWLQLKVAQLGVTNEVGEGALVRGEDGRLLLPSGIAPSPSRQRTGSSPNEGPANRNRAGEPGSSQR